MDALFDILNRYQEITVISHVHPDGDAVGSLLGLQQGLEQLGKQVTPVLHDPVPQVFTFLPHGHHDIVSSFPDNDSLCIVVDLNDVVRTGFSDQLLRSSKNKRLVTIDHHLKGDLSRLSTLMIQDESVSSTAELIYRLFISLGVRITPNIATCLLTGMYTDTGGFQYPNTSTETLEIAAELMRRGARLNYIAQQISHNKTVSGLKLLGIALERLRLTRNGQGAISVLTHEDILKCGATPEDVGGIIGEINVLPSVHFAILISEIEPGILRGTMRTGEGYKVKVSSLAKLLGGGGHPRAAGFTLPGHLLIDPQTNSWNVVV